MSDNNIPESEKELVISFYEAQKTLSGVFNALAIQDEDITATDFILAFSKMVSGKFDCDEGQREELNEYVKSIVSSLVSGTARRMDIGETETSIRFQNDFLIESFPQFMKNVAKSLNYISENAVKFAPQKPTGLH